MPSFNRVVLSGTLASGAESFSTSCAFRPAGGGTVGSPADLQAWAEDVAAAFTGTGLGTELRNGISATGLLNSVKIYFYPSTTGPAATVGEAIANGPGTTNPSRPTTVAMVCSLQTGLAGRRFRGRMYWPALANTINTTGRFTGGVQSTAASDFAQMLTTITDTSPGGDPALASVVSRVATCRTRCAAAVTPWTRCTSPRPTLCSEAPPLPAGRL